MPLRHCSPARSLSLTLCLSLVAWVSHAAEPEIKTTTSNDGAVIFQTVCSQCHGTKGEGNEQIKSPSIASLPHWYFKTQIQNFREGRRGTDPTDTPGVLMAAISKSLQPQQLDALAAHIEAMPLVVPKPTAIQASADLENGRMLFQERCMECHRYNASGELTFGSPPLVGRQDWYLAAQILKFKSGKRGTAKQDVNGAKMVLSSQFIHDDETLRDVIAYIHSLNESFVAEQQPTSDPFAKDEKAQKTLSEPKSTE